MVRPRALSLEATAELCRTTLGEDVSPQFAAACAEATGGNPFLLEELLREAADSRISTDAFDAEEVRRSDPRRWRGPCCSAWQAARTPPPTSSEPSPCWATAPPLVRPLSSLTCPRARPRRRLTSSYGSRSSSGGNGLEFAHGIVRAAVCREMGPIERARAHAGRRGSSRAGEPGRADRGPDRRRGAVGRPGRVELLRAWPERPRARGPGRGGRVASARHATSRLLPRRSGRGPARARIGAELRSGVAAGGRSSAGRGGSIEEPGMLAIASRQLALALAVAGQLERAVGALEAAIDAARPGRAGARADCSRPSSPATPSRPAGSRTRSPRPAGAPPGPPGRTRGERLVLASRAYERARASDTRRRRRPLPEDALDGGRPPARPPAGRRRAPLLAWSSGCCPRTRSTSPRPRSTRRSPRRASAVRFLRWRSHQPARLDRAAAGRVARAECDARTGLRALLTATRSRSACRSRLGSWSRR